MDTKGTRATKLFGSEPFEISASPKSSRLTRARWGRGDPSSSPKTRSSSPDSSSPGSKFSFQALRNGLFDSVNRSHASRRPSNLSYTSSNYDGKDRLGSTASTASQWSSVGNVRSDASNDTNTSKVERLLGEGVGRAGGSRKASLRRDWGRDADLFVMDDDEDLSLPTSADELETARPTRRGDACDYMSAKDAVQETPRPRRPGPIATDYMSAKKNIFHDEFQDAAERVTPRSTMQLELSVTVPSSRVSPASLDFPSPPPQTPLPCTPSVDKNDAKTTFYTSLGLYTYGDIELFANTVRRDSAGDVDMWGQAEIDAWEDGCEDMAVAGLVEAYADFVLGAQDVVVQTVKRKDRLLSVVGEEAEEEEDDEEGMPSAEGDALATWRLAPELDHALGVSCCVRLKDVASCRQSARSSRQRPALKRARRRPPLRSVSYKRTSAGSSIKSGLSIEEEFAWSPESGARFSFISTKSSRSSGSRASRGVIAKLTRLVGGSPST